MSAIGFYERLQFCKSVFLNFKSVAYCENIIFKIEGIRISCYEYKYKKFYTTFYHYKFSKINNQSKRIFLLKTGKNSEV